jgi:DHA1 family multidrug resistance protein-like MFS transporter
MVRALLGTGLTLALTGLSTDVYQLLAFRLIGGFMSGIPPTAMALVASQAPRSRTSFCMGMLQMAIFSGTTFGPLAGGFLTGWVGFQTSFFVAGGILGLMGLLVLVVIKEEFRRPDELTGAGPLSQLRLFYSAVSNKAVVGVLTVMFVLQFSPVLMHPVLPLFLEELAGTGFSTVSSGVAFSVMGLTSAVSSLVMAQLGERIGLKRLIVVSAALSGLFYLPMLAVNAVYQAIILVGVFGLFSGAMVSASSAILSLAVPREQHGRAFGASQSAVSVSFALGPIAGGAFASAFGLRQVFLVSAVAFFIGSLVSARFIRIRRQEE